MISATWCILFVFAIRFLSTAMFNPSVICPLHYENAPYGHHSIWKMISATRRIFFIFGNRFLSTVMFHSSVNCIFTLQIRIVWTPFNMENDQCDAAHLFHFWYSCSFNSYVLSFNNLHSYPTNTHRMDTIQYGK